MFVIHTSLQCGFAYIGEGVKAAKANICCVLPAYCIYHYGVQKYGFAAIANDINHCY